MVWRMTAIINCLQISPKNYGLSLIIWITVYGWNKGTVCRSRVKPSKPNHHNPPYPPPPPPHQNKPIRIHCQDTLIHQDTPNRIQTAGYTQQNTLIHQDIPGRTHPARYTQQDWPISTNFTQNTWAASNSLVIEAADITPMLFINSPLSI